MKPLTNSSTQIESFQKQKDLLLFLLLLLRNLLKFINIVGNNMKLRQIHFCNVLGEPYLHKILYLSRYKLKDKYG